MWKYILNRLLWLIVIMVCVAILIFTIMWFVPGDPAQIMLGAGATNADIRLQFLAEAVTLSCIGGLIGVAIGVGITLFVAAHSTSIPAQLSISSILISFGFSAATGIFFGFYPAYKASKLTPIDALRYE